MRSLLVGVLLLISNEALAQVCTKDSDCSGKLLCIDGTCADAGGGASGGQSSDPKPPPPLPAPPPPEKDESGVNVTYSDSDSDQPADGERMPVRWVSRPLTLPNMVLRPEADLGVVHFALPDPVGDVNIVSLGLGASIGLFDDLELGLTLLPLLLHPDFDFDNIPVYGRYRFLDGAVELGAELSLLIPVNHVFGVTAGLPLRFHGGDAFSLDTGIYFPLRTSVGGDLDTGVTLGLQIPVVLDFQIIDMIFAGVDTGFGMGLVLGDAGDFIDIADTISIPLGLHAGFTLPSDRGPMLDISANFGFPALISPGAEDKLVTELFVFGVSGRFHLFL